VIESDKVAEIEDAVAECVRPEMTIHLTTQARAATRAIQRVFSGRRLGLTLVMCRVGGGNAADLVASGIVRKVIAGSYGAVSSQYTGRYPQVGRAFSSGEVEFEHWSFLSLTQRLMAGAQGHAFVPTHSLRGSTMAATNVGDYMEEASPVHGEERIGLVSALRPDLSFVHVSAADPAGNAIMLPPLEDGAWGALASREGAVVTAEEVVSTEVVRRHSHLVRLPAMYVRKVCETPYGAHPGPFGSGTFPEFRSYEEDAAFYGTYFAAVRSADHDELERWVTEWILRPGHAQYVAALGEARLTRLHASRRHRSPPVVEDLPAVGEHPPAAAEPASANEVIMALAWRALVSKVQARERTVLLVGVGLSEVPAVATFEQLASSTPGLALAMGHGFFGFQPVAGRSEPDPATAIMTTDTTGIYATVLAGSDRPGLAVLGAAQIDKFGNMNSTIVDGKLLTGSGGSNDAASVCETVVVTRLAPGRLVGDVEYVTCAGRNVSTVITDLGVFEKVGGPELFLTSYVQRADESADDVISRITAQCGWPLQVAEDARRVALPSTEELSVIRRFMPARYQAEPKSSGTERGSVK
jgi:acyl CoA:acetate/3-ketoacid CoA transferase alpha subunit